MIKLLYTGDCCVLALGIKVLFCTGDKDAILHMCYIAHKAVLLLQVMHVMMTLMGMVSSMKKTIVS